MKSTLSLSLILFATALGLGCASNEKPNDTVIQDEVGEVKSGTPAPWNERKNTFINQSDTRINAIAKDINLIEKSKKNLARPERKKAEDAISETRSLLEEAKTELGELKQVGAEEWEEEKLEFLSKLNQLEEKYTTAKSILN